VIIDDVDVVGVAVQPAEADAPLVVDAEAVLTFTVPAEGLEAVSRRYTEIVQGVGGVQVDEFPKGRAL
jgi:hypothetical protein